MPHRAIVVLAALVFPLFLASAHAAPGTDQQIGQQFHITPQSLPAPNATPSTAEVSEQIPRGSHQPVVPPGFTVTLAAAGLPGPRRLALGPDGRIYVSLEGQGAVIAYTSTPGGTLSDPVIGASDLGDVFGLGFLSTGSNAGDLIVGATDGLYRVPIKGGKPSRLSKPNAFGAPQGHTSRSVVVDPRTDDIYVGVGSTGNDDVEPAVKATIQKFAAPARLQSTFATGMRNVTAMAMQPGTGDIYAITMERDTLGDELVPDYLTRVTQGDNYGWPYQYIGDNPQPEFADKAKTLPPAKVPDVLFQAHAAPLDLAFVPDSWPEKYRGDVVVALHGSWNAAKPRGYKVALVHFANGRPDGSYENFMTGFWTSGTARAEVWGRPAALAFDRDGSLLVADDLGGTIWRVTPPAN